ncbi:rab-GTPase-TBC domain-containing protein [Artemisia annua]|uniref:Rab-GTPase-TBC domain-containing protein n=1 Tax=Artemisia annua TaxID=35608 RepID=A0A2U1L181_ARTAN|nr:rab-GTPase-TBC domain-containing protein [Artemisia annua]
MSSGEVSPERSGEMGRRFGELRGVQWRIDLGILPCESSSVEEFRRVNANSRRRYIKVD